MGDATDRNKWREMIIGNWNDRSSDSDAETKYGLYVSVPAHLGLPGCRAVKRVYFVVVCCRRGQSNL